MTVDIADTGDRLPPLHPVGVVHGRFQPLHRDHWCYIEAARSRCRYLVIGITNPDPEAIVPEPDDPGRGRPEANPFTYYERCRMVQAMAGAAGWAPESWLPVPLPISRPERFRHYVPLDAVFFLTIYDAWGEEKLRRFDAFGLRTEILRRRPAAEKGITGTEVRRRLAAGDDWRSLVPAPVCGIIDAAATISRRTDPCR
ncbi:MAG: nicotinate-nucleotide adenylyltransferase [Deltaproteobacteria bacterium]|nr:nicotinate-nucleotide adenylyltransferase [Candidatus Anaeroferrophillacea bacterium]